MFYVSFIKLSYITVKSYKILNIVEKGRDNLMIYVFLVKKSEKSK